MLLCDHVLASQLRVGVRGVVERDLPFIYSSWLHSYFPAPANEALSRRHYFQTQKRVIDRLLRRSDVLVLCEQDDHDQILGYIVFEAAPETCCVHWLFVKFTFRKLGLGRWLLQTCFNHGTDDGQRIASHLPINKFFDKMSLEYHITYNPAFKE